MSNIKKSSEKRRRLRDLGFNIGRYPVGNFNSITDIKGVKVGHSTLIRGTGRIKKGIGPVRTGVTAIIPANGSIYEKSISGGGFILNGAGELSGFTQVVEWGVIETPIFLTNSLSVGSVSSAASRYMSERNPKMGTEGDIVIPLVGECDDSYLNDIVGKHIKREHVYNAIENAKSGKIEEGNVGGGTGMVTCDFKGGIGTSSRKLIHALKNYTVGVLVMSNFGYMRDLKIMGYPVGEILDKRYLQYPRRKNNYGSIICIVGTDAPLSPFQLNRLAKRAAIGIGKTGSFAAHGSGEIILAFSNANRMDRFDRKKYTQYRILDDEQLNQFYEATIEATEEAIINALFMSEDMYGINNRLAMGIPINETIDILTKFQNTYKSLQL